MSGCLVDVDVDHLTKRVTYMVGPDVVVETRIDRFGPKGFPKFRTKETWTGWTFFVSEDFVGNSQKRYSFGIVDELELQAEEMEQAFYPSKEPLRRILCIILHPKYETLTFTCPRLVVSHVPGASRVIFIPTTHVLRA